MLSKSNPGPKRHPNRPQATRARRRLSAEARRQQLIKIAVRLFSRRGFAGTTTRTIAREAGVTEAVIFQHFATKEALYAAIIDFKASGSAATQWLEEMEAAFTEGDDSAVIQIFVRRLLDQGERDPEFLRLMLHSALEGDGLFRHFRARQVEPVFRFLRTFVVQRQREGVFADCDPDVLTRAVVAVPGHYILQQRLFQMGGRSSDAAIDEQLTRFILSGLRAAPGSRRANRESDQS